MALQFFKLIDYIRIFSGSAPMPDTAKRLNRIFPEDLAWGLIFLRVSSRNGKSFQNVGLSNALWRGSTIPDVFLKTPGISVRSAQTMCVFLLLA